MWIDNMWGSIKPIFTIISRVMRLEDRVTTLEGRVVGLQMPEKDLKEGLLYNKVLNIYEDKTSGECFCPTCLGNKKRIAFQINNDNGHQYWTCYDCKSSGSDGRADQYPRYAETDD